MIKLRNSGPLIATGAILVIAGGASAETGGMPQDPPTADTRTENPLFSRRLSESWHYGGKGLEFTPADSDTALWIGLRFQTRYDDFPGDKVSASDLRADVDSDLDFRRARIKGGGTLFTKSLRVYSEYDFPSSTLLDLRLTAIWRNRLAMRIGQWKSEFNRERIDSSGKQQLAERSISTYWFTIDRQQGVAASMRFFEGRRPDTRVYLEYLSGHGRGGSLESGDGLWLTRVQWNPAGTELPFSQSDLKRRDTPVPSIALAVVDGTTPYTRFSSGGGGSLPGFDRGDYDLRQYLFETAVHYRGLAWQQELHFKRITDRATGTRRELLGGYAQLGSFINEWWPQAPAPLEVVGRIAIVDPDRDTAADTQAEYTLGVNWFFQGHRNKLTADFSYLDFDDPVAGASKWRFRLQWELSL